MGWSWNLSRFDVCMHKSFLLQSGRSRVRNTFLFVFRVRSQTIPRSLFHCLRNRSRPPSRIRPPMIFHRVLILRIQPRRDVSIQPRTLSRYWVRFDLLLRSSSRAVSRPSHSSWSRDRHTRVPTFVTSLRFSTRTRGRRRTRTQPHVPRSLGSPTPRR